MRSQLVAGAALGAVLLVWVIGFLFDVAGGLVHLLLLVALGLFLVNILSGRRRAV